MALVIVTTGVVARCNPSLKTARVDANRSGRDPGPVPDTKGVHDKCCGAELGECNVGVVCVGEVLWETVMCNDGGVRVRVCTRKVCATKLGCTMADKEQKWQRHTRTEDRNSFCCVAFVSLTSAQKFHGKEPQSTTGDHTDARAPTTATKEHRGTTKT